MLFVVVMMDRSEERNMSSDVVRAALRLILPFQHFPIGSPVDITHLGKIPDEHQCVDLCCDDLESASA